MFLDYVGRRFGQSVKASIEGGELVVTEIDDSVLPKFETEEDMKEHTVKLNCWEHECHTQAKCNCNKLSMVALQRLSST